jgi:hypothetical protein
MRSHPLRAEFAMPDTVFMAVVVVVMLGVGGWLWNKSDRLVSLAEQ